MRLETPLSPSADTSADFQPVHQGLQSKLKLAWFDIKAGLFAWQLWYLLSWQDIRLRYRRSRLGPFWITASMAVTIYSMGFLYARLFKMDLYHYYPYLAGGMLTWNLINLLVTESTNALVDSERYIKQVKLPYIIFILRSVCRNFIIFFHNILVIIPIIIFLHLPVTPAILYIIPGLLLIFLSGISYGMIFALVGACYRDMSQIITSLMQVAFFLTPIIWDHSILTHYQWIVSLNPFAQYIELIRAPLLGHAPATYALIFTSCFTIGGICMAVYFFANVRHRIIFWL